MVLFNERLKFESRSKSKLLSSHLGNPSIMGLQILPNGDRQQLRAVTSLFFSKLLVLVLYSCPAWPPCS